MRRKIFFGVSKAKNIDGSSGVNGARPRGKRKIGLLYVAFSVKGIGRNSPNLP